MLLESAEVFKVNNTKPKNGTSDAIKKVNSFFQATAHGIDPWFPIQGQGTPGGPQNTPGGPWQHLLPEAHLPC